MNTDLLAPLTPERRNTAAIVVTHDPDAGVVARLEQVRREVAMTVVVDNASRAAARRYLPMAGDPDLVVLQNSTNLGLGRALNQGMALAIGRGCAWALALDQDSLVHDGILARMRELFEAYPHPDRIGLLSANARSPGSGLVLVRCPSTAHGYLRVKTVITSGSLLSLAAYRSVGPFREDFFIEGIDLEYSLRLRRSGYHIIVSCQPLMTHAAGRMEERRVLRRPVLITNHPPWRYYYMMRNLRRIAQLYFRQEPAWMAVAALNILKLVVKVTLFEEDRWVKLRFMAAGMLGVRPRHATIPDIPVALEP